MYRESFNLILWILFRRQERSIFIYEDVMMTLRHWESMIQMDLIKISLISFMIYWLKTWCETMAPWNWHIWELIKKTINSNYKW